MGIQRRILKSCILLLGDIAMLWAALFIMLAGRYPAPLFSYYLSIHLFPFSVIFAFWVVVFFISGLYELRIVKNTPQFYQRLSRVFLFNTFFAITIFYLLPYFRITPRANLFFVLALAFLFVAAWRWGAQRLLASRGASRILFFGLTKEVVELAEFLKQNPQLGYLPAAAIDADGGGTSIDLPFTVFPLARPLPHVVNENGIEIIVASSDIKKDAALAQTLFRIVPLGIPVIDFLSFYESAVGKIPVSLVGEVWFLENLIGARKPAYEFVKRTIDIALSSLLGICALGVTPIIAGAIALDAPGPIFYRQKRIGRHGKTIEIIKFRSMQADAESGGVQWADENDPRATRVGALLRKTRLDEIPQLWNILKGDLSLIGPRPERPEFVALLDQKIPFYQMRHLVTPGLSGWAQINFPYGASIEDALEKLQYDLAYIKNRSLWIDLTILLRTIRIVLSREGR